MVWLLSVDYCTFHNQNLNSAREPATGPKAAPGEPMTKIWPNLLRSFLASIILIPPAVAKDVCGFLHKDDSELTNGSVFYATSQGWTHFSSFSAMGLGKQQTVTFVYVVRELFRGDRSGALVVKSGVYNDDSAERPQGDRILLVRKDNVTDRKCPQPRPFNDTLVSGKGYEDYHEYQATETPELKTELTTFERFHFKYWKDSECVGTDDARAGFFDYDYNASQFSYNTSVVDGGARVGIRFNLFGRPVYAGPEGLWQRRTELKYYHTVDGMHCSKFNLVANGDDRNFLRINDLEGRQDPPSKRRAKEFRVEN